MWKVLEFLAGKIVERYEVSERSKDSIRNWTGNHLFDILAQNLAAFYPYSEDLLEPKF